MELLHESTVLPTEIDTLGHMNVRYYIERMDKANRVLLERMGVDTSSREGLRLRRNDTYMRFLREQFEGAKLHAVGGMLELNESGMRSFVEIRNAEDGTVAASFVANTQLIDVAEQRPMPFQGNPVDDGSSRIEIPAHGQPRTLSLGAMNTDVTADDLDERLPETGENAMVSGKHVLTIRPDEVDGSGWFRDDLELMFLPFIRKAESGDIPQGPPVVKTADGRRVGWAVMEQRNVRYAQPREGEQVRFFAGELAVNEKSRHSRRWAFSASTGQVLGINDSVGVCLDLDARRAIPWPDEVREQIERYLVPDLA